MEKINIVINITDNIEKHLEGEGHVINIVPTKTRTSSSDPYSHPSRCTTNSETCNTPIELC